MFSDTFADLCYQKGQKTNTYLAISTRTHAITNSNYPWHPMMISAALCLSLERQRQWRLKRFSIWRARAIREFTPKYRANRRANQRDLKTRPPFKMQLFQVSNDGYYCWSFDPKPWATSLNRNRFLRHRTLVRVLYSDGKSKSNRAILIISYWWNLHIAKGSVELP